MFELLGINIPPFLKNRFYGSVAEGFLPLNKLKHAKATDIFVHGHV